MNPKYLVGRNPVDQDDSNNISRFSGDGKSRDIILPDFDPLELSENNLTISEIRTKKQRLRLSKSLFVFKDDVPIEFNDTSIAILTESRNKKFDNRGLGKLWKKFEFDKNDQAIIP